MEKPQAWGRGRGQAKNSGGAWGPKIGRGAEPMPVQAKASQKHGSGSSKFDEACLKIQASTQKFLLNDEFESSEEEDDDDFKSNSSAVLTKVLNSYAEGDSKEELSRTQQFLLDSVKSGANVCLICIATVKKSEAIWSCSCCYCIFHLPCIQTWAKDNVLQQSTGAEKDQAIFWCCPKCRFEYQRHDCPSKYLCFCGKEIDPKFDPWLVPHTCGQVCGKALLPDCGHKCNLLCHPGPCPPCPKTVQVACQCGNQKPQTRRCSSRQWFCGKRCGKLLSCNQHSCTENCHEGFCKPCSKTSSQLCLCRREKTKRLCAEPVWQCSQKCGRQLSCGHHTCDVVCHAGDCLECPRSKKRFCPCGKTGFDLPCTKDISTCGDTCGKILTCGVHLCAHRCHVGPCSTCLQMSVKRCRCGAKEKSVPCHKEFTCDIKCKNLKDCRKHPCNKKCCDGNCPLCEQLCGRVLGCRNHKCSSRCHPGPCYPCPLMVEVKCNCGASISRVPCGREKVTPPPKCSRRCQVPPICHHQRQTPHRCHFGDCPPCKQTCEKSLNCSHRCPSDCHSAVVSQIKTKQKRAGPWEPEIAPRLEIVCQPCPPCQVPMPVTCIGQHETQNFPCFMAKPGSCHRKCGRKLSCSNHGCSLDCHVVVKAPDKTRAGENCSSCEEPCSAPRPEGCSHPCLRTCHPKACPQCTQMIKMRCYCGQVNAHYVNCTVWVAATDQKKVALQSCGNQCPSLLSCGHRCPALCHKGSCSEKCTKKVFIKCPCKSLKRESTCNLVQKGDDKVECDKACKEKLDVDRKTKHAEDKRRREEETKKEKEELERFQRKMEGRKRKPRKERDDFIHENETHWYKWVIAITAGAVLLVAFMYALLRA